jgi:uncharacterized protein YndB with AHSA1/START domain
LGGKATQWITNKGVLTPVGTVRPPPSTAADQFDTLLVMQSWQVAMRRLRAGPIESLIEEVLMNEVQIVCVIERPVEDVFAALVNYDRVPDWNSSVIKVRWKKDAPLQVGSTIVYVGKFLGRTFESDTEITEYVPGTKYSAKTTSGPFQLEIENALESLDGSTRLTSVFRGESRGFFKLAEPVVVRLTKKLFEASTENLKAMLEAQAL